MSRGVRGRGGQKRPDNGWSEQGGYMNAKIQKLDLQNIEELKLSSNTFRGISIFVNGYTKPSSDELKRLVVSNGGVFHHYYSRTRVTHIIASNLPASKISQIRNEKVVKPQWIADSVAAGRLLPYQNYLLYVGRGGQSLLTSSTVLTSNSNITTTDVGRDGQSLLTSSTVLTSNSNITTTDVEGASSMDHSWAAVGSASNQDLTLTSLGGPNKLDHTLTYPGDASNLDHFLASVGGTSSLGQTPAALDCASWVDTSTASTTNTTTGNTINTSTASAMSTSTASTKNTSIASTTLSSSVSEPLDVSREISRTVNNSTLQSDTIKSQFPSLDAVADGRGEGKESGRHGSIATLLNVSAESVRNLCDADNSLSSGAVSVLCDEGTEPVKHGDGSVVQRNVTEPPRSSCEEDFLTSQDISDVTLLDWTADMFADRSASHETSANSGDNVQHSVISINRSSLLNKDDPITTIVPLSTNNSMSNGNSVILTVPKGTTSHVCTSNSTSISNTTIETASTSRPTVISVRGANSCIGTYNTKGTVTGSSSINSKSTLLAGTVNSVPAAVSKNSVNSNSIILAPRSAITTKSTSSSSTSASVRTADDPKFVAEFYNNSRLHHLSTWGSECKVYVNELVNKAAETPPIFEGRERLREYVNRAGTVQDNCAVPDIDASLSFHRMTQNKDDLNMGQAALLSGERIMAHVDMDCFFVSVGLLTQPDLRGRPVAVTHSRGRGPAAKSSDTHVEELYWTKVLGGEEANLSALEEVKESSREKESVAVNESNITNSKAEISSCSYEARKAGVRNGMFFGTAKKLCPDLVPIPYDFEGYQKVSRMFYDIVASYTLDIEAVSCDEMYIDCTDLLADTGSLPHMFADRLRADIQHKTGCTASVGLGSNMLLARLATRKAKPNGQYQVKSEDVEEFLRDVAVSDLPGVGYVLSRRLKQEMKVEFCRELRGLSLATLQQTFGRKTGEMLLERANGRDSRAVRSSAAIAARKSVSAEINYGIRFKQQYDAEEFLSRLSAEVHNRMVKVKVKAKMVTLKLKVRAEGAPKETAKFLGCGICDNISKSSNLATYTDNADVISRECQSMLRTLGLDPSELRGVGIQMTQLDSELSRSGMPGTTSAAKSSSKGSRSILEFATTLEKPPKIESGSPDGARKTGHGASKTGGTVSSDIGNSRLTHEAKLPAAAATASASMHVPLYSDSAATTAVATAAASSVSPANLLSPGSNPAAISTFRASAGSAAEAVRANDSQTSTSGSSYLSHHHKDDDIIMTDDQDQAARSSNVAERESKVELDEPPLPLLPDLDLSQTLRGVEDVKGTKPCKNLSSASFIPSLSQIDIEVLNELPEDVKQEILSAVNQNSHILSKSSGGGMTSKRMKPVAESGNDEEVPGCSHWSEQQRAERGNSGEDVLSYSQLDESFLRAMPQDIQAELKQAYQDHKTKRSDHFTAEGNGSSVVTSSHLHPLMRPEIYNSPQKASPLKGQGRATGRGRASPNSRGGRGLARVGRGSPGAAQPSPSHRVTRGRPRGSRTRGRQKRLHFDRHSETEKQTRNGSSISVSIPSAAAVDESSNGSDRSRVGEFPSGWGVGLNLAGRTNVEDIKDLLEQWTTFSHKPDSDDVDTVRTFICELIAQRRLDLAHTLLKLLKRLTTRGLSSSSSSVISKDSSSSSCTRGHENSCSEMSVYWRDIIESIISASQSTVSSIYGGQLKL